MIGDQETARRTYYARAYKTRGKTMTHEQIAADVAAFEARGGKIEVVPLSATAEINFESGRIFWPGRSSEAEA